MKVLGIIPARYASTRFPGKPLALIHGKSMIERVFNRASQSERLSEVVVATDDDRIHRHVLEFGGKSMMTSPSHPSGTDRCAEVLSKMNGSFDVVINIQGDEPYIHSRQIDLVISCFENIDIQIATLIKKINNLVELENNNIPKVVIQGSGRALYFSRYPVPFCKESEKEDWLRKGIFNKHIGIYGYRSDILPKLSKLSQGVAEVAESLEQLRWLEHGYPIMTAFTEDENMGIDTPGDITTIESRFRADD